MLIALFAALLLVPPVAPCSWFLPPVEGRPAAGFAPQGRYEGHWGVDWEVPVGTLIRAVAPGTVTFSGVVVGNRTVTIHHGGGLRTSYSYLSTILVSPGELVARGRAVGRSGLERGEPRAHLSLRIGAQYLDPLLLLGCRDRSPMAALRLRSVR